MAKWYGAIGYAESVEIEPGIWSEEITERNYYGEVFRNSRRLQSTDSTNDNVLISNQIRIISDPYATDHFYKIRYAVFAGVKWKVSDIEVQWPALTLTLGGVYNGE